MDRVGPELNTVPFSLQSIQQLPSALAVQPSKLPLAALHLFLVFIGSIPEPHTC